MENGIFGIIGTVVYLVEQFNVVECCPNIDEISEKVCLVQIKALLVGGLMMILSFFKDNSLIRMLMIKMKVMKEDRIAIKIQRWYIYKMAQIPNQAFHSN